MQCQERQHLAGEMVQGTSWASGETVDWAMLGSSPASPTRSTGSLCSPYLPTSNPHPFRFSSQRDQKGGKVVEILAIQNHCPSSIAPFYRRGN